ncbi:MAG: hypothetical protein EA394_09500 [Bacteroidia bacterium]|nr:MAG: hypothetical protein EA394_09500 [Bacteroidia bacterium]
MQTMKELLKSVKPAQSVPYAVAILLFILLTIIYVNPILEGKMLFQPDIVNWQGMSREIVEHREATGEEALWTNSMFGGMPAYQISVRWANNIADFFHDVMTLWLPRPADMIFLYFAGFFLFLLMLRINPWVALAGAVGFAFSSYHFIIIEAGHNSKAVAIAYMAPVLGAVIYTFRSNMLGGGLLFAIFMGLQLYANHFQMTYYLGFIVAFYGIFELWEHYRDKRLPAFLQRLGILAAGLIVAIGINFGNFWGTYSYTSETMRGGTELTIRDEPVTSGLDKDYITAWSYGIEETLTLLIPNAKGGATGALGQSESALNAVEPMFRQIVAQENHYWGNQPFTSGPVYVGAVVLFFFFLSLFYVKAKMKWALVIAIILSILLSWGKNFMPLTDFFIDYIPGYNKFRAVSMTLVIAGLCIPALAFMGLYKLYQKPEGLGYNSKPFLVAAGFTAGLSLFLYVVPGILSFISEMEARGYADLAVREPAMASQINEFLYNLEEARKSIFRADALRSFFFALAAAGVTLLFAAKKIGKPVFIALVVVLLTADMWPVNRRYLNNDDFEHRRRVERPFPLRAADQYILENNDQFRVLDLTESTFNSSRTSYYHHSIGGYHGAKLQRYQDLIDFHLTDEMLTLMDVIQRGANQTAVHRQLQNKPVLNMLNTRYIIYHPEAPPLENPHAMGNAWLLQNYTIVNNADEELLSLQTTDLTEKAVVDQRFARHLEGFNPGDDPEAQIMLVMYKPNHLVYEYRSATEQLALFSEIYYPDGWEVTLNGNPVDHFRANYLLRAMVLPPGEYTLEFRFRPAPYYTGRYISLSFSVILVIAIMGFVWMRIKPLLRSRE